MNKTFLIPVGWNRRPSQAVRRASSDLLDRHPLETEHFLGFGNRCGSVALPTLAHGVVPPGIHFILCWKVNSDHSTILPSSAATVKKIYTNNWLLTV